MVSRYRANSTCVYLVQVDMLFLIEVGKIYSFLTQYFVCMISISHSCVPFSS